MNQKPNQEIPTPAGVPAAIETHRGRTILKRMALGIAVSAGGLFVVANLVAPARCAGATRSSKLKWQERQEEIGRSIEAAELIREDSPFGKGQLPSSNPPEP